MRTHLQLLFGLLLCLMQLGTCTVLKSRSVKEIMVMIAEDGDRQLREPMHPIRGRTRVLIFALDGVGRDNFLQAVRTGRMPRTAALLGGDTDEPDVFAHGYAAPGVLSVLPSSTTAAWASTFTGRPPAETGIPGNEWFDRGEMRFYAPSPVTVERRYQVLQSYNEDVLGARIQVPTLYERAPVRSHVSLSRIYRGADLLNIPEIDPFGSIFNAAVRLVTGADSARHRLYERLDETSIKSLEESLARYGIADLQTVYLPGVDLFTHISPQPLESQRRYLQEVIDPIVGKVLDLYGEKGVLGQTYVLFVSDHGQTPVAPEGRNALWREGDGEPPALLRQVGFRVRPWGLKTDGSETDFQAALAFQGGMAYIYLADRSTCPDTGMLCDWSRAPRREEDLMAVVRAFDEANRTGAHVPALQGRLDLIFARVGALPGRRAPVFQVFDGARLVPIGAYLKGHPRPDLLDLERRLADLAAGPYGYLAGDVLLLSRLRLEEPVAERTYFGEGYHTWHGSPNRQDSEVVFVLAHPHASGPVLRRLVRAELSRIPSQMDATPLVLSLLNQ